MGIHCLASHNSTQHEAPGCSLCPSVWLLRRPRLSPTLATPTLPTLMPPTPTHTLATPMDMLHLRLPPLPLLFPLLPLLPLLLLPLLPPMLLMLHMLPIQLEVNSTPRMSSETSTTATPT